MATCHKGVPSYPRTARHREMMSKFWRGRKRTKPSPSTRPEVAQRILDWWTSGRREAARQRGISFASDPNCAGMRIVVVIALKHELALSFWKQNGETSAACNPASRG